MTKSTRDKIIMFVSGFLTTFIGALFMWWINKADAKNIQINEKTKTDIKVEVKQEIRPELDKKLDKIVFEAHLDKQDADEKKLYNELKEMKENQRQIYNILIDMNNKR